MSEDYEKVVLVGGSNAGAVVEVGKGWPFYETEVKKEIPATVYRAGDRLDPYERFETEVYEQRRVYFDQGIAIVMFVVCGMTYREALSELLEKYSEIAKQGANHGKG